MSYGHRTPTAVSYLPITTLPNGTRHVAAPCQAAASGMGEDRHHVWPRREKKIMYGAASSLGTARGTCCESLPQEPSRTSLSSSGSVSSADCGQPNMRRSHRHTGCQHLIATADPATRSRSASVMVSPSQWMLSSSQRPQANAMGSRMTGSTAAVHESSVRHSHCRRAVHESSVRHSRCRRAG